MNTVDEPKLDMSSLVDVSFLLLIYFLVSSTLEPRESDIGMTMPDSIGQVHPMDLIIDEMRIDLEANGDIRLNEELLETGPHSRELPILIDRLATYVDSAEVADVEPKVILAANDAANGQRFVDVLNALAHQDVQIRNVALAGFE